MSISSNSNSGNISGHPTGLPLVSITDISQVNANEELSNDGQIAAYPENLIPDGQEHRVENFQPSYLSRLGMNSRALCKLAIKGSSLAAGCLYGSCPGKITETVLTTTQVLTHNWSKMENSTRIAIIANSIMSVGMTCIKWSLPGETRMMIKMEEGLNKQE